MGQIHGWHDTGGEARWILGRFTLRKETWGCIFLPDSFDSLTWLDVADVYRRCSAGIIFCVCGSWYAMLDLKRAGRLYCTSLSAGRQHHPRLSTLNATRIEADNHGRNHHAKRATIPDLNVYCKNIPVVNVYGKSIHVLNVFCRGFPVLNVYCKSVPILNVHWKHIPVLNVWCQRIPVLKVLCKGIPVLKVCRKDIPVLIVHCKRTIQIRDCLFLR